MSNIVKYESGGHEITLSPSIVRQYLVSGQGNVSDQEIVMFIQLCKFQKLNPFLREVYLIKYGNNPAQMVTGKETFLKRARRNPLYQGHKTGISADGKTAWAEVYVKGDAVPIRVEVDYEEYVGRKSDGTVTGMWRTKPKTMLKKVALVQAMREAFPDDFGGLYSQEEINTIREELPTDHITTPTDLDDYKDSERDNTIYKDADFDDIIDEKNDIDNAPPKEPEQKRSFPDAVGKSDDDVREELSNIADEIVRIAPHQFSNKTDVIKHCSYFKTSDGDEKFKTRIDWLKDKWLRTTYGKAKSIYDELCAAPQQMPEQEATRYSDMPDDGLPF